MLDADLHAILRAEHGDPFAILGMHEAGGIVTVRAFIPWASRLEVVDAATGEVAAGLVQVDRAGMFVGEVPGRDALFRYRLRAETAAGPNEFEDIYSFATLLGPLDFHLLGEGRHFRSFDKLGAHHAENDGVPGINFLVWAPNASNVSLVGDFNGWDGRQYPMRLHPGNGMWELFVPRLDAGRTYKYEIRGPDGVIQPLKADPYGQQAEHPPHTASIVPHLSQHRWEDAAWVRDRGIRQAVDQPISIYEVHLGSWRRKDDGNRYLTYRELADELVPYVKEMGFTHLEVMPVSEFPFDGSWGYQPVGLFAPTSRFGKPDDFRYFVDRCHQEGIALWLDWVPGHFPTDPHGLARFDGTALYEHADPRQGFQHDWNTYIYNFGRREVFNFLLSNALYWLDIFHADGLRVDAVASILYLDYSRKHGEWVPNRYGGRENLEAIELLRELNQLTAGLGGGAVNAAEESTAWPGVSRPVAEGGLGFGYKWNMGWMHDTLRYMSSDPVHRAWQHDDMTFGMVYAFTENFILPLSHDEVVHGKGSLIDKMPGDWWQKFANLRAYYSFMWTHPGKKLLFMGCEFAQWREWNHDRSLDWHLLEFETHRGVQSLIRDLNLLYRSLPALHQQDCDPAGFAWLEAGDRAQSVLAYLRRGRAADAVAVVVCNFTPVVREEYRVGVPQGGWYAERLNSDAAIYGGGNVGNGGGVEAVAIPWQGQSHSIVLRLPPLATLIMTPQ